MDTVPWLFIEGVYLLLDPCSRLETGWIPSTWDACCSAISKKIHTLQVLLDGETKKIYAAALPALECAYSKAVSLDSVDLKFITNFRIRTCESQKTPSIWKEITLDDLQRLVRPMRNEHPLSYDYFSFNILMLKSGSHWINGQLLSMQLPVDSVDLEIDKREEAEEFFANAGPLYSVTYLQGPILKKRTLDVLIEKFVPIGNGYFQVCQKFSKKQLTRLFEKCAMSGKKVESWVLPDDPTASSDSVDFVDYDKYYSEKEVLEGGKTLLFFNREQPNLKVRVNRGYGGLLRWEWFDASEMSLELTLLNLS
uniref:FBA_2 domain-containing protein n=1 Tax=Steinernema glaseri TaxID=37863 RepID=A0A1I8AUP0_9BILA